MGHGIHEGIRRSGNLTQPPHKDWHAQRHTKHTPRPESKVELGLALTVQQAYQRETLIVATRGALQEPAGSKRPAPATAESFEKAHLKQAEKIIRETINRYSGRLELNRNEPGVDQDGNIIISRPDKGFQAVINLNSQKGTIYFQDPIDWEMPINLSHRGAKF